MLFTYFYIFLLSVSLFSYFFILICYVVTENERSGVLLAFEKNKKRFAFHGHFHLKKNKSVNITFAGK